jgi:hypothetical protein
MYFTSYVQFLSRHVHLLLGPNILNYFTSSFFKTFFITSKLSWVNWIDDTVIFGHLRNVTFNFQNPPLLFLYISYMPLHALNIHTWSPTRFIHNYIRICPLIFLSRACMVPLLSFFFFLCINLTVLHCKLCLYRLPTSTVKRTNSYWNLFLKWGKSFAFSNN